MSAADGTLSFYTRGSVGLRDVLEEQPRQRGG
jgi:hypothetical protein